MLKTVQIADELNTVFSILIVIKNAFQWDAYCPLVDRIPACTAQGVYLPGGVPAGGCTFPGMYLPVGCTCPGGGGVSQHTLGQIPL